VTTSDTVCLVDVDNTLLDNDQVQQDLSDFLVGQFGPACRDEYWSILSALWDELGYRDYLGALQRYRIAHPHDVRLLRLSSWLLDYPFARQLYPSAIEVIKHLRASAQTVILSDGDVVFQPHKVHRSGLWHAVDGHVLIYIHKEQELADIAQRYPAERYVVVDDKRWILAAFKRAWGERVTTVMPLQGQYVGDPRALTAEPPPDVTVTTIADLLTSALPGAGAGKA
jgi:FMN phosphatase YigB (HAD superfamily)